MSERASVNVIRSLITAFFLLPPIINGIIAYKKGKDPIRYILLSIIPFVGVFLIFFLLLSEEAKGTVFTILMSLFGFFFGLLIFKTSDYGDGRLWGITAGCVLMGVGILGIGGSIMEIIKNAKKKL
jgi:hypothetical protein